MHTKIANDFYTILEQKAQRYKAEIKKASSKAFGAVIQNPFYLYFTSANSILELIEKVNAEEKLLPNEEKDIESNQIINWNHQFDLCKSAFFLYIASFEGLLNLIYDLYLKPNLRDERISDRLSREQIDIKLRLAPVYCECFKGNLIDNQCQEFKNFHSLMNLRNDFIHANLTKPMRSFYIEEDGFTFLIEHRDIEHHLPSSFGELNYKHLVFVKDTITQMIDVILSHMSTRYKKEFRDIMYDEFIVVNFEDGEIIVSPKRV